MRAVRSATWTSGEPVSDSWVRCFSITAVFSSIVMAMASSPTRVGQSVHGWPAKAPRDRSPPNCHAAGGASNRRAGDEPDERGRIGRFREVRVEAGERRRALVVVLAPARQRDQEHVRTELGSDPAARLEAVDADHPEVEKHQIRTEAPCQIDAALAVVGDPDLVP